MCPQIYVGGISIFKGFQVALMGRHKNKYSDTETYGHRDILYTGSCFKRYLVFSFFTSWSDDSVLLN